MNSGKMAARRENQRLPLSAFRKQLLYSSADGKELKNMVTVLPREGVNPVSNCTVAKIILSLFWTAVASIWWVAQWYTLLCCSILWYSLRGSWQALWKWYSEGIKLVSTEKISSDGKLQQFAGHLFIFSLYRVMREKVRKREKLLDWNKKWRS